MTAQPAAQFRWDWHPKDSCAEVLAHVRYPNSHNRKMQSVLVKGEQSVESACQFVLHEMHIRCPQLRLGWGGKDRCCHAVPLALRSRAENVVCLHTLV